MAGLVCADQLSGLSLQDDEINHQSQMVEKLKEQMLDQEEVDDLCFPSFHPFCLRRPETLPPFSENRAVTRLLSCL